MHDDLVTIATFLYLTEAEAAKMHLEAEGIRAFLADAEIVSMDWLIANAVGDIKLQVPKSEAEIASVMLAKMRRHKQEQAAREEGYEGSGCLACGAEFPEDATVCPRCGWSFTGGGEEDD